ncbi:MAG: hypothetical protein RLZZ396_2155 [Planctomycetota bacterium]
MRGRGIPLLLPMGKLLFDVLEGLNAFNAQFTPQLDRLLLLDCDQGARELIPLNLGFSQPTLFSLFESRLDFKESPWLDHY